MDAAKKTQLEQRLIAGLVVFFAFTLWNAGKSLGLFRSRPPQQTAVIQEKVDLTKPLAQTFEEHWKRMEPMQEVGTQALRPPHTSPASPFYTAHDLRDPLQSLLPQPDVHSGPDAPPPTQASGPSPTSPMPALTLQGMWLEAGQSRAIINGKIYGVGDHIDGLTIVSIDRSGVTLEFQGKTEQLTATGLKSAGWR